MNAKAGHGREQLLKSLRGQIATAAPEHADAVLETLLEAMKATKRGWGTCGSGRRVELQVQDAAAAVNAAKVLMEQAEGRPSIADAQDAETMVIRRLVVEPELTDVPAWLDLANEAAGGDQAARSQGLLQLRDRIAVSLGYSPELD